MRTLLLTGIVIVFTSISLATAQTHPSAAPNETIRDLERKATLMRLRERTSELVDRKRQLQLLINEDAVFLTEMRYRIYIDGGSVSGQSPLEAKLLRFGEEKFKLERAAAHARDRYESLAKRFKEGQTLGEVEDYLDKHPRLTALRAQLDSFDDELRQLTVTAGPKDDKLVRAQAQRDALARRINQTDAELRNKVTTRIVDAAHRAADDAMRDLKEISESLDTAKRDAADLAAEMDAYLIRDRDDKLLREELRQINIKLNAINVEGIKLPS